MSPEELAKLQRVWEIKLHGATCGWCGEDFLPARRGPIAKWCSNACRQAAYRAQVNGEKPAVPVTAAAAPKGTDLDRLFADTPGVQLTRPYVDTLRPLSVGKTSRRYMQVIGSADAS
jgi:hypothetical protein